MKHLARIAALAVLGMILTGCASDGDRTNVSSRPWNSPRGWEHGFPAGINEGR
jgi:hypothetical protein